MLAADLVIQGTVLTVDELQPTAEALAVSDGRIIAVGERADVESWIGPGTEVIDMYEDALRRWPRDDHPLRPSGRVLAPAERLTVEQAIRAQTIDAAWQLLADDVVGSLEVGKYAEMVVLSADPRTVPPEEIADLEVRADVSGGPAGLREMATDQSAAMEGSSYV